MWAPPENRRSSGMIAICNGTTSSATTPTYIQSRPRNVIHENAYDARAETPTEISVAGMAIFTELRKKCPRLIPDALPRTDE